MKAMNETQQVIVSILGNVQGVIETVGWLNDHNENVSRKKLPDWRDDLTSLLLLLVGGYRVYKVMSDLERLAAAIRASEHRQRLKQPRRERRVIIPTHIKPRGLEQK